MKINITGEGINISHDFIESVNLLNLLQQYDIKINAPCGGKGTCGKCTVEIDHLGKVLACKTNISEDWLMENGFNDKQLSEINIRIPEQSKARISTEGIMPEIECIPLLSKGIYFHQPATIKDQRADDRRFEEITGIKIPFALYAEMSDKIHNGVQEMTFLFRRDKKEVVKLITGISNPQIIGMAIDIGTTTLASYLYDLETGERLAMTSMLNPQRNYGADVISRIEQIDNDISALKAMQMSIFKAICEMSANMKNKSGLTALDIQTICISGNTTMMHILTGLNPSAIARSPFIPVSISEQIIKASEIGFIIDNDPLCIIMPSISAYVGADITAGILACQLFPPNGKKQLLLDIGTNGEIVLSTPDGLTACSTAAGPAFEAANISCGMSGSAGAIEHVDYKSGQLICSVIEGNQAEVKGICGSGLVSAIAMMLKTGIIDETGRFTDEPETLDPVLAERLSEYDDQMRFYLDKPSGDIYISQKDIRELQNAKAAIAAGVERLLGKAGIKSNELDEILIAGGFGNYLRPQDAFAIGLLPEGLEDRTKTAGNTSAMGAIACLLNDQFRIKATEAAEHVRYYELSSDPEFTDLYIDAMIFP